MTHPRVVLAGILCLIIAGCGGGPGSPPPPIQPTPDFHLSVTPARFSLVPGASTQIQVSKTALNGFTGVVSVDASSVPTGVTISPSLPQQINSSGLTLLVAADPDLPPGSYTVGLVGTSGNLKHPATMTLSLRSRANLSFVVSNQVLHVPQAGSSSVSIGINSDTGIVDFDVQLEDLAPSGITATFSNSVVPPNTSVSLTLAASSSALLGAAFVDVLATRSVDGVQFSASIPICVDFNPAGIGGTITEFPLPTAAAGPSAITQGPDLAMWFGEESTSQLGRIAMDGSISEFPVPTSNAGLGGVAAGIDGNLYFTEFKTSKVGRYSPLQAQFAEWDTPVPVAGPGGIVSAPDGTLWVLAANIDEVFRLTTQGNFLPSVNLPSGCFPHGPTIGNDGNLWFACVWLNQIVRVTPQGAVTSFALPKPGSLPTILTTAADGNIYFTEQAGRIGEFNLTTLAFSEWTVPTNNSVPYGISAAGASICFTERSAGKLGCMPVGGGTIAEYSTPSANATPSKVALGPDGKLWFTEQTGNNVGQLQ